MSRNSIFTLFIVLLFILLALPTLAQESTAEPTPAATVEAAPILIVTAEPGSGNDVNVTVNNPPATNETPPPTTTDTPILSLGNLVSFLVGGVVAAGSVLAFIGAQARTALHDPARMVLAEKLGDSIPKETADKIIDALTNITAFFREATDRQSILTKPTPTEAAPVSTTRILTDPGTNSGGGGGGGAGSR